MKLSLYLFLLFEIRWGFPNFDAWIIIMSKLRAVVLFTLLDIAKCWNQLSGPESQETTQMNGFVFLISYRISLWFILAHSGSLWLILVFSNTGSYWVIAINN